MPNLTCSCCSAAMDSTNAAPSVLARGGYCRRCAAEYMRAYKTGICVICSSPCGKNYMRCGSCRREGQRRKRKPSDGGKRNPTNSNELRLDPKTGRPAYTKAWKRLRQSVIDEGTHCGFCGEVVDKYAGPLSRDSPAVDHIIPLSLGGDPFDRANLRLAHHGCNSSAGAMAVFQAAQERVEILRLAVHLASCGL